MLVHELVRRENIAQSEQSLSHAGGYPNMPANLILPKCQLCGANMTFFFQLEFPKEHQWKNKIMAVFACTSCSPKENITPLMSPDFKHIPDHFLDTYAKNFFITAFSKAENPIMRSEYIPKIKYEVIEIIRPVPKYFGTKLGGKPDWRISNDFPENYMGNKFTFLLQILDDFEFPFHKLEDAPPQSEYPRFTFDTGYRTDDRYVLFGGVPLYFFGTLDTDNPQVYVMNQ